MVLAVCGSLVLLALGWIAGSGGGEQKYWVLMQKKTTLSSGENQALL
jgi:hypothetical protein